MDDDLIKNLLAKLGGDRPSTLSPENKEKLNKSIESLLSGKRSDGGRGTFLFDPVTNKLKANNSSGGSGVHYDISGNPKETGPGTPDDLRTSRIDGMREPSERSKELKAQSEGIRSGNADRIKDNLANGRNAFEGMQTPGQVKAEQRAAGKDEFAASQAAGQQFRDMFSFKGAQGDALRAAGKEGKAGEVYDALKQSRADNLKQISQDRIDSGAKPVGSVQSIEADGRVLAQRTGQEEGARVASGGIDGALGRTVDGPGKMELTKAGQDALTNRTYTATSTDGTKSVAGAAGTAIGGKLNFPEAITSEQRTGQAPLSEANQKYKDSMLAGARDTALKTGTLDSTSSALAKAMPAQTKDALSSSPISNEKSAIVKGLTAPSDSLTGIEKKKKLTS